LGSFPQTITLFRQPPNGVRKPELGEFVVTTGLGLCALVPDLRAVTSQPSQTISAASIPPDRISVKVDAPVEPQESSEGPLTGLAEIADEVEDFVEPPPQGFDNVLSSVRFFKPDIVFPVLRGTTTRLAKHKGRAPKVRRRRK
jgi:hypothetical protein